MPFNINFSGTGSMAIRSAPTPSQVSSSDASQKPAPKVDLPSNVKSSVDPTQARKNVKEAVSFLNEQLSANNRGIGFTVNEGDSTPIVTVRNTQTGEVVRQIPNDVVI